jgi:hypothetical protein
MNSKIRKMIRNNTSKRFLQSLFVLLLAMAVPAVCQQKNTKPAAPSKPSAPAAHPSTPTARPGAPGNGSRPGATTNTSRPGGMTNTSRPGGTTNTSRPGGATNTGRPGGSTPGNATNRGAAPGRTVSLKSGGSANFRPNGQVRSINSHGMQISRGLHGGRTVVSTRNGARIVTTGAHGGFVQRAYFARGGRTYVSRTYVVGGRTYVNVYRSYGYGGYCCYYGWAPAYYWHPGYYGWAYNPWAAPVYYGWGWGGAPWYGYYGAYWAPYPVYPSAAFWLTDWIIAANLQAAYAAQAEANAELSPLAPDLELVASLGPVPVPDDAKVTMSKEVKDQLAEEIKAQLAADQADAGKSGNASSGGQAASNEPLPALDPKRPIFVVNDEVSTTADGDECSLTNGDILSRESTTPDADKNVQVKVLASKKTDCAVGKEVAVSLDDLQEMRNHFREQLSGGMDELSKKQGTGGLPKAPDTGKQDGEVPAPAADASAAKTLQDQQSAADQAETEAKQANSSGGTGGGSN